MPARTAVFVGIAAAKRGPGENFCRTPVPANDNRPQSRAAPGEDACRYDELASGANLYRWDPSNRLTEIAGTASFTYDGLNRRQSATVKGRTISYLFDGEDPVQEQSNGTVLANLLTGMGVDERFTRTEDAAKTTFLIDAIGSTIALVNDSGVIQTNYGYGPYGNMSVTGAASDNSYQFTGRQNDGTGLNFYRARYYNSIFGRFISEDPLGLQSGDYNFYRYVGGSPTNYTDPSGEQAAALPPAALAALALATGMSVYELEQMILQMARGVKDKGKLPNVNPGRDCDGKCKPCPPGISYWKPGAGHGHSLGHWVQLIYNQNPDTCECFGDRPGSGLQGQ